VAIAAAMLLPSAAQASSKTSNDKHLPGNPVACQIAAPAVPHSPAATSQIILNGAPSALDLIRANQQGAPAVLPVAGAPVPILAGAGVGVFPAGKPLEPASRGPMSFVPLNPAPVVGDCDAGMSSVANMPSSGFEVQTADWDPAAELGTRAIPIKRTRFDALWDRVRRPAPTGLMRAQLDRANVPAGLGEQELLARVNQWVNGRIAYVNDDRNYRQSDFWATAEQTLARGSGDCEDFAILKMQLLRAAGVDSDRMKLVLLRDLAANADHAFLLVQTDGGKLVLDNTTNLVYDGSRSNSVRPVLSFSDNRRWVHAYRGVQPSPNLVAVPASRKSFALAQNDQRSVSAAPLTFKIGLSK
jgi:predicted transglutaminase-like cysteine proteinase